jgi:hypothetical protein
VEEQAAAAESANTSEQPLATELPTPDEEVPTPEELPTPDEPGIANTEANAEVLAIPIEEALAMQAEPLAVEELEKFDSANTFEAETRLEPRRNPKTGKLRGIAWRERNKERKAVYYVGINSKEPERRRQWEELRPQFEKSANAEVER